MSLSSGAAANQVQELIDESVAPPEQRWARRRTASAPAIVHLPGRESTIPCRILDQSATGAQLEAQSENARDEFLKKNYEAQFWLYLPFDRAQVKCEVVWFAGKRFGVRYISPMHFVDQRTAGHARRR